MFFFFGSSNYMSSQFKMKLLLQDFHRSIYWSRILIFHFVCPDRLAAICNIFSYQISVGGLETFHYLLFAMLSGLSVTLSSSPTPQLSPSATFPNFPLHLTSLKYQIILLFSSLLSFAKVPIYFLSWTLFLYLLGFKL